MKTAFYILFKEYSDSSRSPSALYIKDNTETDPEQIVKEVNEWLKIARFSSTNDVTVTMIRKI